MAISLQEFIEPDLRKSKLAHGGDRRMNLQSRREVDATREKLRMLENRYEASKSEQGGDDHVRELSMRSLKHLINQLKEEIARFESRCSIETQKG